MTKGYALALIFTTLSVFGSLFYLQHRMIHEQYHQLSASKAEVQDRVITQQIEQQQELVRRVEERLKDDTKARFRPVQPFFEGVRERQSDCLKLYQRIQEAEENSSFKLPNLATQLSASLKETREAYARLLFAHGENMDLTKEDAMALAAAARDICTTTSTSIDALVVKQSGYQTTVLAGLLMTDFLQAEQQVLELAERLVGGKTIECGGYFPVFLSDIYNPKRGQTVKAKVAIGSYSTSLNPEDVILTAGGDTLTINPDGTADYEFSSNKRGQHTVDLIFRITNALTGEVKTGESSHTYNIR